jgi:hypothetical protein
LIALGSRRPLRAWNTLQALFAARPCGALRAAFALHARRALNARNTRLTLRPVLAL